MAKKGPGKSFREGLTLLEVADMFRDEERARRWLELQRWPHGPCCPECGSLNVQSDIKHRTMTHRCRDCPEKTFFSLRKGTIMEGSKLSYRVWAIGIYLFMTNIKGISSMRLHRELGISQKAAWFMLHRLRKAMEAGRSNQFTGPVEADETYMGGKRKNMSNAKRRELADAGVGRGPLRQGHRGRHEGPGLQSGGRDGRRAGRQGDAPGLHREARDPGLPGLHR